MSQTRIGLALIVFGVLLGWHGPARAFIGLGLWVIGYEWIVFIWQTYAVAAARRDAGLDE